MQQSFTIAGGDPAGVTFTVTNLPPGGANCEVVETDVVGNYTPSYFNGWSTSTTSCAYSDIAFGAYICEITNSPSTFDFVVDFEWDDTAADATGSVPFTLMCENVVDSMGMVGTTLMGPMFTAFATTDDSFTWSDVGAANDDEDSDGDPINETMCWVDVGSPTDMTVEVMGCDPFVVTKSDDDAECMLTASVFFEGIPTLSQYGMALMALLMLGIGFIGLRRFA